MNQKDLINLIKFLCYVFSFYFCCFEVFFVIFFLFLHKFSDVLCFVVFFMIFFPLVHKLNFSNVVFFPLFYYLDLRTKLRNSQFIFNLINGHFILLHDLTHFFMHNFMDNFLLFEL